MIPNKIMELLHMVMMIEAMEITVMVVTEVLVLDVEDVVAVKAVAMEIVLILTAR